MCSCLEELENKTIVHPDGSITRTILFTGDSSAIARRSFKLRIDSSWTLSTNASGERSWSLKAEQTFHDTRSLNDALRGEPGKTLTATVHLEKSFQWFFTSYRYKETWKCFRMVNAEPLLNYVSDSLLDMTYRHEVQKEPFTSTDSLLLAAAEGKLSAWDRRNLFEANYREFLKGVEMVNSPRLTSAEVERRKDELFQASGEKIENGQKGLEVQKIFGAVLQSPVVAEAFRANARGFESLDAAREFDVSVWTIRSFKLSVTMPGTITATNGTRLEGSTVRWEEFLSMVGLRDTPLTVESRSANWWAIVLTGVVAVAILVYLTASLLRRRLITSGA
jgi:hypothetical protein